MTQLGRSATHRLDYNAGFRLLLGATFGRGVQPSFHHTH
ncbi:hypothetical protein M218_13330 [Burkholderia pseudomallei MSHR338]|uniref:Uncharacterized protein n=2 Tax=Burkholderia pseudomallei TaxID=28450 RepID=A0A0E1W921_BURPE|nr:hypothetical protein BMASAVP1_A2440 [Burkholderia mallei SAVP1]ABN81624.1 hypothetical protein BURPS668_2752 [Burkholderia pseudomallei 668]ABN88633.1 hypothetical protein BURPS1106A_2812 [Burkholderia pseudomallei 1106a]ABO05436.1 hypothetical protein BMA10247_1763 [Burkholderia mallei NCTC 10247]ACQ96893.1 conserved hypothetical protein [Burkholderia pseudomallei MSHR346]AFR16709.1 hypothetical protein BPC006_I2851 [Burkholderia pseudomallei BPC006]EBA50839.1 hypothetical protein BURPS30